jgi:hypothetical protein
MYGRLMSTSSREGTLSDQTISQALTEHKTRLARIERAHAAIRATVDTDARGEWIAVGEVAFAWDDANIFRVRPSCESASDGSYVFGSGNVVACIARGHIGPAIVQAVRLEMAAEIRGRARSNRRGLARREATS